MNLDAAFLREWAQDIASRHLVEFSNAITDPTEPLLVQHTQETP